MKMALYINHIEEYLKHDNRIDDERAPLFI